MASQFLKRKLKLEAEAAKEAATEKSVETGLPVYTQKGFDVFTPDGGRSYKVIELEYNPDTGAARVTGTSDISRLIALKYDAQKVALGILKKGR